MLEENAAGMRGSSDNIKESIGVLFQRDEEVAIRRNSMDRVI